MPPGILLQIYCGSSGYFGAGNELQSVSRNLQEDFGEKWTKTGAPYCWSGWKQPSVGTAKPKGSSRLL